MGRMRSADNKLYSKDLKKRNHFGDLSLYFPVTQQPNAGQGRRLIYQYNIKMGQHNYVRDNKISFLIK